MDSIILKIKKLLSRTESPNENEAKVSMLKAQELLAKYKLTMREIEDTELDTEVITKVTDVTFRSGKWKGKLASVIADNFRCYCYCKTRYSHKITFLGKESDVKIAEILLTYAVDNIERESNRLAQKYRNMGYSAKGLTSDYALGFINGLHEQFERQKAQNQEWGLVLVKDKEVQEEYSKINFKGSINTNSNPEGFSEVYRQGVEDGEKFRIDDRIEESRIEVVYIQ